MFHCNTGHIGRGKGFLCLFYTPKTHFNARSRGFTHQNIKLYTLDTRNAHRGTFGELVKKGKIFVGTEKDLYLCGVKVKFDSNVM